MSNKKCRHRLFVQTSIKEHEKQAIKTAQIQEVE